MFLGVFVLSLGLRCHLGVYRNIVRDVSFLYFGDRLLTTLSKSVSSIWSIIQLNGWIINLGVELWWFEYSPQTNQCVNFAETKENRHSLISRNTPVKEGFNSHGQQILSHYSIFLSRLEEGSRGVAIICKRNLNIKVLDTWSDNKGRMTIAKIDLYGRKIAIISAYAPNKFDKEFYSTLTQEMLQLTE